MTNDFALRRRTAGFTLIEMMIAMAISLFLLLGLASLTIANSRNSREMEQTTRQIESGRYAVQVMTEDLNLAGFYGSFAPKGAAISTPDPCATGFGNLGFNNATSPITVPAPVYGYLPAASSPLACLDSYQPNTGVVVVRRVSSIETAASAPVSGEVYVQSSGCGTDTQAFVIESSSAAFTLHQKDCTAIAPIRKYLVRIYYVSSCGVCTGSNADSIPTLKVAELVAGAITVTPLAEGIQDMRPEYGVDLDGNGSADCYVSDPGIDNTAACAAWTSAPNWNTTVQNWGNVMTARLQILARNSDKTQDWTDTRSYDLGLAGSVGPFKDNYKRHAYSAVARLINVSGLREQ